MLCYCRQFLFTEYALKTDILPMARDMCMIWELTKLLSNGDILSIVIISALL